MGALVAGTIMSWNIVGGTLPNDKITFPSTVVTANSTINITTQFVHSWLIRLNYIGALVGVVPTAFSAEQFGRRIAMVVLFLLFGFSWVLKIAADMRMLISGMTVGGICIGAVSVVVPTYICELVHKKHRGTAGSMYFAMFVLGQMITGATSTASYIWYTCTPLFFLPIFLITIMLAPESPPYLLYKLRPREAAMSFLCLRKGSIREEFLEMNKQMIELSDRNGFKDIFIINSSRRGAIISLVLLLFLALCGAAQIQTFIADFYGIRYYYVVNFASLGTQVIVSLLAGRFSDFIGRRIFLIVSAVTMALSLALLGLYYKLGSSVPANIFVFVFIIGYSSGFGPLPWIMTTELLPINVKWIGCSSAVFMYWLVECLFYNIFRGDIEALVGKDLFVWIVSGICVLAAVFVFFFVPETKNLSYGEIKQILETKIFHFRKRHNTGSISGSD